MSLLFYVTVVLVTLKDVNGLHHKSHDDVASSSDKVHVSVYYESLCPDSISFIKHQLWPTYEKLSSIMMVELIPYGKASDVRDLNHQWQFTCQHGPGECKGNMVQACAVHLFPQTSECLPFVTCAMSSNYPPDAGSQCATKVGLNWGKIFQCANGVDGENVLHEMGVKTESLSPKLHFVPWILINGKTSNKILDEALTNLTGLVCRSYQGQHPPQTCN